MLMNLIGNAIKFTARGHVRLVASINWDASDSRLLVEIHDTGIGIPADRIEQIFLPFEQADCSITGRFGGTGLGLAISRHIVDALGGRIAVESQPGRGTIFRVSLPTGPLDRSRALASIP